MDNKNDDLKLQVKFSQTNMILAILLLWFYAFVYTFSRGLTSHAYIHGMILVALLLSDALLGKFKYFYKLWLIRIIRGLINFSIILTAFNINNYKMDMIAKDSGIIYMIQIVFFVMALLYCIICAENMFLYDITEVYYQINAIFEMIFPVLIVALFEYLFNEKLKNTDLCIVIILIITVAGILFAILSRISGIIDNFNDRLFRQERLAINSKEEYDNLKIYQSKLVRANEQLSKQKLQLEIANTTITRKNTEMKMQHMLVNHMNSELDANKIISFITNGIKENLNLDLCAVIIRKMDGLEETEELLCSANATDDSSLGDDVIKSIRDSEFIKLYSIVPNATYLVDNRVPDAKYDFLIGSNIGSLLICPMVVQDNARGVLVVGKNSYGYFKENISFYETIVEQIILALKNAFMYQKVQNMAIKDALTTIYNRRYFNSLFPMLAKKALEEKRSLTVALFDIDKFKNVNDTYGHIFGDIVIKYCGKVAGRIAKEENGYAVRYGGEEFVLCFMDKSLEETNVILKKMHEEIKQNVFDYEGETVKVNVSIGITAYPQIRSNVNDLLSYADNAMYMSKKNGRGRITIDSDENI